MRDALEGDLVETGRREDAAPASCLVDSVGRGGSMHAPTELPDATGASACKSLAGRAA